MAAITNPEFSADGSGARRPAGFVSAHVAVTSSEQFTVPTGATHCLLSGNLQFYVAFGANPTATVPAADDDTGVSCELITPDQPVSSRMFLVSQAAKVAVAAPVAAIITASFYKM